MMAWGLHVLLYLRIVEVKQISTGARVVFPVNLLAGQITTRFAGWFLVVLFFFFWIYSIYSFPPFISQPLESFNLLFADFRMIQLYFQRPWRLHDIIMIKNYDKKKKKYPGMVHKRFSDTYLSNDNIWNINGIFVMIWSFCHFSVCFLV